MTQLVLKFMMLSFMLEEECVRLTAQAFEVSGDTTERKYHWDLDVRLTGKEPTLRVESPDGSAAQKKYARWIVQHLLNNDWSVRWAYDSLRKLAHKQPDEATAEIVVNIDATFAATETKSTTYKSFYQCADKEDAEE